MVMVVRCNIATLQAKFTKVGLAQSVEHGTLIPRVVRSSPTSGAFFTFLFTDAP